MSPLSSLSFLDSKSAIENYSLLDKNVESVLKFEESPEFPLADTRVSTVRVMETCGRCMIRIHVDIASVLDTKAGEPIREEDLEEIRGELTLVEALGTAGAFRELFLTLVESTEFSKSEVSQLLREETVFTTMFVAGLDSEEDMVFDLLFESEMVCEEPTS